MRTSLFLERLAAAALAVTLAGAAPAHHTQPTAHHTSQSSRLVIIQMDLDFQPHKRSSFGKIKGYDPAEVHVHMGDKVQWVNVDDENHTATGMAYTGNS